MLKPVFSPHFPFIRLRKSKRPIMYKQHNMGEFKLSEEQQLLTTVNRSLLLENQVPINKIRFVYQPTFTYDIDKNSINPKYTVMLPVDAETGRYVNEAVIVEIGKPKNIIVINVDNYKTDDNYLFLKSLVKNSKRGIVIFIADETVTDLNGQPTPYKFSVDDDVIRIADLDVEVLAHQPQQI